MRVVLDQFEAFVGVNFFTMIFAWINLVILYVFLKKLLFKPVKNMIDSRQKEIDDMYSDAESSKQSADEMKAEYEEKIAHANEESEEILRRAVRRAELREEEILKEANIKAARTLDREYMSYCDRCGQRLAWDFLDFANIIFAPRRRL